MRLLFKGSAVLLLALVILVAEASGDTTSTTGYFKGNNAHVLRNVIIGNAVAGAGAYLYFSDTWGTPNGKFHFKHELSDNVAFTDEISHFYAGYKLYDGCSWLFRVLKMPPEKISRYAAFEALLITTLVEFPMDSYNPSQGFGTTDIVADYAGVGVGVLKRKYPCNFDMKFSVKRPPWKFENKFLASKNEEFDNFIWWGVWKPKYVWLGAGYSTNHFQPHVKSEYYLGVGTTVDDLIAIVSPRLAKELKGLDCYFINLKVKL